VARGVHTHLAIEIQQVKSKQVDPDGDVLRPHVFALSARQVLERQQPLRLEIVGDSLGIYHERFDTFLDALQA
jgi:hypothetical protein